MFPDQSVQNGVAIRLNDKQVVEMRSTNIVEHLTRSTGIVNKYTWDMTPDVDVPYKRDELDFTGFVSAVPTEIWKGILDKLGIEFSVPPILNR